MRILISGGTVVNSTGPIPADVLVEGEHIVGLVTPGSSAAVSWAEGADRVLDATGLLVIPGGIDGHTHMEMPFGGTQSADTFETGTRAAAFGGTTTIIDFAIQSKGHTLREGLDTWHAKADGNCAIDYGFHMIVSDVNEHSMKEMDTLVDGGVTSFKLFMAYPGVFYSTDGEILRAMQQATDNGSMIMMHAENGIAIDALVAQALERGETDPRFHGATRPSLLEGEATHRAIQLARVTGAPLYIVHLSATEALDEVVQARDRGQSVFAETCPQYLFLSEADMARPGFEGAKYVCSPPLRDEHHQIDLWRGLRTDDLSIVSTDHCPFCFKDQKELGRGDFSKIPNGLPGVEHRMDLIFQGVERGEISLERWVDVTSTSPARMFGLFPKKGVIAPGSDADIVLYDPQKSQTFSATTHHMKVDYSAYEGTESQGKVTTVLSRGTVVVEGEHYVGKPGDGRFLHRGLNGYLR
ncbi:MAG: dihydropyrimidinase [Acidimicrobiales bacterium]